MPLVGLETSHTRGGLIVWFEKYGFEKLFEIKSEFKTIEKLSNKN